MPDSNKKIGLYFGTFNPIHIGHLIIANHIINDTDVGEVWFVVSPHSPFKNSIDLLDDYARLELLHKAVKKYHKLSVSDIEFSLSKPSYTFNTLVNLVKKYPNKDFSLIMGRDNLSLFHKWKNYELILENHKLYIYPRLGSTPSFLDNHNKVHILDAPIIEIASSVIRHAIKNKIDIRAMLPPNVWEHINAMNYYRK